MNIEILKSTDISVNEFLFKSTESLIYYSDEYLKFLTEFLTEDINLIVIRDSGEILGIMPFSIKESESMGKVLNSSPFYGSNGGIFANSFNQDVYKTLLIAFDNIAVENNCIASTFITSPFEKNIEWFKENYKATFIDYRIGQITNLPKTKDELMGVFHSKTRNTVRKAIKSISRIEYKEGLDYLNFIFETHKENISAIGGIYKPYDFFTKVINNFPYNKNLKIYIGFNNEGIPISGLLNLYYNKTIEYFCPVTVSEYRELQPLSGVIYQAMLDGIGEGYENWNWGGTWSSQGGVYNFKSRWGTTDLNYYYFTKLYNEEVLKSKAEVLLKEFPYYFVVPFDKLLNE